MNNSLEYSILLEEEKAPAESQKAFEGMKEFFGILPADFDYKKELAEWRDDRYGSAN